MVGERKDEVHMSTLEIYRNYGCLSAEKRIVYTYSAAQPTAVTSDQVTVQLPQGWTADKGAAGGIILTSPDGQRYLPDEVLAGNEQPMLEVCGSFGSKRRYMLKVVSA